ncbi:MAG: AraC family transcriptional regulator [Oscillospiraceae bacterium]|nr:AraC family transcriptional regulator [Oscillospiraceae bacterium]
MQNRDFIDLHPFSKNILSQKSSSFEQAPFHALPSEFAKQNLFYVHSANKIKAGFPFHMECGPFNSFLILFSQNGEGMLGSKKQSHNLKAGSIAFIDCSDGFKLDIYESRLWEFKYLLFNGFSAPAYFRLYYQENFAVCETEQFPKASEFIDSIYAILRVKNNENSEIIISKLITDLLTHIIMTRQFNLGAAKKIPQYIAEIKNMFSENISKHYSLDELAQIYGISKYKLIYDFKKYLGCSPINYLIKLRIELSKELLKNSTSSVYQISSMVGIENPNHYISLFKKAVGMTPGEYRNKCSLDTFSYFNI